MFKEERGITLVALVVTIIILLILAGVTITFTLSQNGLLTRAQEASNVTANATKNEAASMQGASDEYDAYVNQYVNNYSDTEAATTTEP